MTTFEMTEFMPSVWNSIFIPSVPTYALDENIFKHAIENVLRLGRVKRVDFSLKKGTTNKYMAFIHFHAWFNTENVMQFRRDIEMTETYDIHNIWIPSIQKYIFIRCMINRKPIKEAELNIHQLADCLEMAECKIQEQTNDINNILKEFEDYKTQKEMEIKKLNDEISKKNEIIQKLMCK